VISARGNASIISSPGGGRAITFSEPEAPVVVLYTLCQKKYTFLHLRLDKDVFINRKSCRCRDTNSCRQVVIESVSKLDFKRHSAQNELEKGLNTWDLARFRLPRHPGFRDTEQLTNVQYIRLDFSTVREKEAFQIDFETVGRLRDLDRGEQAVVYGIFDRRAS